MNLSAARRCGAATVAFASFFACRGHDASATHAFPKADVRLVVDDMGITHVYAQSDGDALYGAGYAMARDRLMQMEVFRRQALGTSSELFGAKALKADLGARAFGFRDLGVHDEARARAERPADAALVDAWCAGVNARVDEVRAGTAPRPYGLRADQLDLVPAPWIPAHAFAIGKLLAFGLSNSLDSEILATALLKLAPDVTKRMPLSLPAYDTFIVGASPSGNRRAPAPPPSPSTPQIPDTLPVPPLSFLTLGGGHSNNWAVAAAHSANGKPLVAGDPHQALSSPTRFWPVHMSSVEGGGTLDVVGFVFPGTPVVELGHNAHVGWTATTNFADVMDMWDVQTDPDRTLVHLADGNHAIVARKETIQVRTDAGLDATDFVFEDIPGYGVLLPEQVLPLPHSFLITGNAILFNWVGFRPTLELSAFLAMDRAKNVDDFDAAVDLIDVGALNSVAADAEHVTYRSHSLVPDRGTPGTRPMPWHVLPADAAGTFWTGATLGPDRLPHVRDPARGYVSSANNDPWGFTADGNVENDPFYYGAFYATAFRAYRIDAEVGALVRRGSVTRADFEALQNDTHSPLADSVLPRLADAIAAIGVDTALDAFRGRDDLRALALSLASWDRRMVRERGEPVVFNALQWFAARRLFNGPMPGALFDAIASKSPPYLIGQLHNVLEDRFADAASFLPPGGKRALLLGALDDVAKWLMTRFGTLDVTRFTHADVNLARFASAFGHDEDPPPVAVDGSVDTIKVCESTLLGTGAAPLDTTTAIEVSLYRMVVAFGDDGVPEATIDFARGVREDPSDPHFGDQQERWLAGGHAPLAFRKADVEARATERSVLK